MRKILYAIVGCAAVGAAVVFGAGAYRVHQAEATVRAELKDPDAGKFSDVTVAGNGLIACGKVNSKNGFGGYTGPTPFLVWNGEPLIADDDLAADLTKCCSLVRNAVAKRQGSDEIPGFDKACRGLIGPYDLH